MIRLVLTVIFVCSFFTVAHGRSNNRHRYGKCYRMLYTPPTWSWNTAVNIPPTVTHRQMSSGDKSLYKGVREVSLHIKSIAGKSPIIGLGRSPSPITTFLSLLDQGDEVSNLPMSDFRSRPTEIVYDGPLPDRVRDYPQKFEPLSSNVEDLLFEHFDKFLSAQLKDYEGDVYLIDFSISGSSLFAIQAYLNIYARRRGINVEFKAIVLTGTSLLQNVSETAAYYNANPIVLDLESMSQNTSSLRSILSNSSLESYSEYTGFDFQDLAAGETHKTTSSGEVIRELRRGEPNEQQYKMFVEYFKAKMATDPELMEMGVTVAPANIQLEGVSWDEENRVYRDSNGNVLVI